MPDISRIKLQNNEVYEIKDAEARRQLELLLGTKSSDERDVKNSEVDSEE